jgi:hypothetical protein
MVFGCLNVVKDLKRTNQIVSFARSRHMIGFVDTSSKDLFGKRPQ